MMCAQGVLASDCTVWHRGTSSAGHCAFIWQNCAVVCQHCARTTAHEQRDDGTVLPTDIAQHKRMRSQSRPTEVEANKDQACLDDTWTELHACYGAAQR
eukprot:1137494-Pelagomonas_calceolata.AAC.8